MNEEISCVTEGERLNFLNKEIQKLIDASMDIIDGKRGQDALLIYQGAYAYFSTEFYRMAKVRNTQEEFAEQVAQALKFQIMEAFETQGI